MRLVLIGVFAAIGSAQCLAQEEVGTIAGAGWVPCAEFAQLYQQNPKDTETYYFAWAQGYMTGLNDSAVFSRKNLRGWRLEQQKQHIRAFCDKHPLQNVVFAVRDLYSELPAR